MEGFTTIQVLQAGFAMGLAFLSCYGLMILAHYILNIFRRMHSLLDRRKQTKPVKIERRKS